MFMTNILIFISVVFVLPFPIYAEEAREHDFSLKLEYSESDTVKLTVLSLCKEPVFIEYNRLGGVECRFFLEKKEIALGRFQFGPMSYVCLHGTGKQGLHTKNSSTLISIPVFEELNIEKVQKVTVTLKYIPISSLGSLEQSTSGKTSLGDFVALMKTWTGEVSGKEITQGEGKADGRKAKQEKGKGLSRERQRGQ